MLVQLMHCIYLLIYSRPNDIQNNKVKAKIVRKQTIATPSFLTSKLVKTTTIGVVSKVMSDISLKTEIFNKKIQKRNIQSSKGPRIKRCLYPQRVREISTPPTRNLRRQRIDLVGRLKDCRSPLEVLSMGRTMCAPYLSFDSPIHQSVLRHKQGHRPTSC